MSQPPPFIWQQLDWPHPAAGDTELLFALTAKVESCFSSFSVWHLGHCGVCSPNRMVSLPSVSGYSTVFLCGSYPGFIMKTAHSIARFHKMVGDSVRSVCQFNVINGVENGFLYYNVTVLSFLVGLIVGYH